MVIRPYPRGLRLTLGAGLLVYSLSMQDDRQPPLRRSDWLLLIGGISALGFALVRVLAALVA